MIYYIKLGLFPLSTERFHPRSPGLEGRVDVYRVATHVTACVSKFASVCNWNNESDDLFSFILFYFFQICIRVLFYSSYLRACFFFSVNHLLGKGVILVDSSNFCFIFNFCAT